MKDEKVINIEYPAIRIEANVGDANHVLEFKACEDFIAFKKAGGVSVIPSCSDDQEVGCDRLKTVSVDLMSTRKVEKLVEFIKKVNLSVDEREILTAILNG